MQPPWRQMHVAKHYLTLFTQMVRIRTTVLMFLFALTGSATATGDLRVTIRFVATCLAIAFLYVLGTCLNDIADQDIDQINLLAEQNGRPLLKGNGKSRELVVLGTICATLALLSSVFISWLGVGLTAIALIYSVLYSLPPARISYRGLLAPLTLPLVYVVYTFMLGYLSLVSRPRHMPVLLLAGLFAGFFARIILKDLRDVKGDKMYGKRTFTVRYGVSTTAYTSIFGWIVSVFCIGWYFYRFKIAAFLIALACLAIIIHLCFLARETVLNRQLIYVASVGRLGNLVVLLILTGLIHARPGKSAIIMAAITILFALMTYETDLYLKRPI